MSIADLDPVIHAPKRLGVMALLAGADRADFGFVKDHLDISDSDLSKQVKALAEVGYVDIRKRGHGRSGSTTFKITRTGQRAYDAHVAALRVIVETTVDVPEPSQ